MKKEDLSPEQLEAFTSAMAESKNNIRSILLTNLLNLIALTFVNTYICAIIQATEPCKFFIYFMTSVLVVSGANKSLMEEADRFREESQKILNNNL